MTSKRARSVLFVVVVSEEAGGGFSTLSVGVCVLLSFLCLFLCLFLLAFCVVLGFLGFGFLLLVLNFLCPSTFLRQRTCTCNGIEFSASGVTMEGGDGPAGNLYRNNSNNNNNNNNNNDDRNRKNTENDDANANNENADDNGANNNNDDPNNAEPPPDANCGRNGENNNNNGDTDENEENEETHDVFGDYNLGFVMLVLLLLHLMQYAMRDPCTC